MLNLRLVKLSYIALFIFSVSFTYSQKYNIKHLSSEEGLIQSQINSIVQGKNGELFLCSDGSGIVTYDGKSFSNFEFQNENIKSNNITKIFKDSKSNIWFCSPDGLIKYDGRTTSMYTQQDGLPDNNVKTIFEDKKGIYWIGSKTGLTMYDGKFNKIDKINNDSLINDVRYICSDIAGRIFIANGSIIQRIHNNTVRTYKIDLPSPRNVIRQIFYDSQKRLWAATVAGLYYLENNSFVKFTQNKILANNSILKIFESSDSKLWFSVRDYGIIRYGRDGFTEFNETNGLNTNLIFEIFQGREGNIWFGTNEGLDLFAGEAFVKYDKLTGLPENLVWSIIEDNKNNIWVVTDKYGISIFKNGVISKFTENKTIDAKQYYGVFQDRKGFYWIAARTGLFKYDGKSIKKITDSPALQEGGVSGIYEDSKNNLWFCTFNDGVVKYDGIRFTNYNEKNGLMAGETYYTFDAGDGNVWITTSVGISIFDGMKFTNYSYKDGPIKKEIFSLKKDKRGNIWGASFGDGIYKITLSKNSSLNIQQISTRDGLLSDNVYLIEIDDYDRMWVGTQTGLCSFLLEDYYENKNFFIKKYNKEDGIPHAEYNQAASFKDSKGFLWFGTNKGLIKCDPSVIRINNIEPTTYIKSIKIFYRDEDLSKYGTVNEDNLLPRNLELPYSMNHVTFEFIGISLTNSSKVRYKYILENFDKEWRQSSEKNSETYSNLPSGNYTFKVLACNDDGLWNKTPVSYSFKINTPFYHTWWFISSSIILFFFFSWLAYKMRMRKIQLLNKELEKSLNERIITEKKLIQSENDYRGLFENAHDAILIIDPIKLCILAANKEACRMYGYTLEELTGISFSEISDDYEVSRVNIFDTLKTVGWGDYEVLHRTKTGEHINVDANATVINYKGNPAIVAILHNITERKNIEKALIDAKEHAEKSDLLKSNFLAQMSHEIRTPVNTILNYTSLLKSEMVDCVTEELKESFQFIENGGRRLIRTIDSILNMSQIQSGNQEIFPGQIKLHDDILFKLFNEFKLTALNNSIDLSIVNKAEKDIIIGDNYSITQLFSNLIDNAIKYTPKGKVVIVLENKDPQTVTAYIEDTGIGISEEFLPKIFQPFSQEEIGYTRHFEGNGLGLALVKSYCDINHGTIEVESKKGVGTTFMVTFSLIK